MILGCHHTYNTIYNLVCFIDNYHDFKICVFVKFVFCKFICTVVTYACELKFVYVFVSTSRYSIMGFIVFEYE